MDEISEIASAYFKESIELKIRFMEENLDSLTLFIKAILKALSNGNKLLICGNGGSAADAQHFSSELIGRFNKDRQPIKAIALTTDTSILTAVSNDYGFEEVFVRQVRALGEQDDVLVAISTSGTSPNILKAAKEAKSRGMIIVSFTGRSGGSLKGLSDYNINVDSDSTAHIQEIHATVIHLVCLVLEAQLNDEAG